MNFSKKKSLGIAVAMAMVSAAALAGPIKDLSGRKFEWYLGTTKQAEISGQTLKVDAITSLTGTSLTLGGSGTAYLAKSADYTITDTDNARTIGMTTSSSDRTVTLPAAANNTHRMLTIKKIDSGSGQVIVDGAGSETIDDALTFSLPFENDRITIQSTGTAWEILSNDISTQWQRKFLGSNVTTDTSDISDLHFSNLTVGRTYRISGQLGMDDASGDDWQISMYCGTPRIIKQEFQQNGGTGFLSAGFSAIFVATATSIRVATEGMGGGATFLSSGTENTFIFLEELPRHSLGAHW